jgi:hypothetical protein
LLAVGDRLEEGARLPIRLERIGEIVRDHDDSRGRIELKVDVEDVTRPHSRTLAMLGAHPDEKPRAPRGNRRPVGVFAERHPHGGFPPTAERLDHIWRNLDPGTRLAREKKCRLKSHAL